MNNLYLSAESGMAESLPVFLILPEGNSYIHIRDHMIRVKEKVVDSVG